MKQNHSNQLDKNNVEDMLALTPMQEGLLFHHRSDKGRGYYTQQFSARLSGECSVETFRQAWQIVAKANDVLRTVYRWEKLDNPLQIVLREREIPISIHNYSNDSTEQAETRLVELKRQDRTRELNLEVSPIRITLCQLGNATSEMIITWHHILFDGWSNGILIKEFMQTYQALSEEKPVPLRGAAKTAFKHFVRLQQLQDKEEHQRFWERELAGWQERSRLTEQLLELPLAQDDGVAGARHTIIISATEAEEMNRFTNDHGITIAAFMYTAWGILLGRYCRVEDVLFGTTVSGRTPELHGMEEMIGLFINTIPLRMCWKPDDTVHQIVKAVNEQLKRRVDFELTPLIDISTYSGADHYEPLFNTIVVVENYPLDKGIGQTDQLQIAHYEMEEATHYGMTIGINLLGSGEIELDFAYDAGSFTQAMVARLAGHYAEVLRQLCRSAELLISEIGLLTEAEREQLLYSFNQKQSPKQMPEQAVLDTVKLRFERQAEQSPNEIAMICSNRNYTFAQINTAANRLAHQLRALGVQVNEPVAIYIDEPEKIFIAMLAVLKSGAAYVPIDYDYAPGRINQMLQDCKANILVTMGKLLPDSISFGGTIVNINEGLLLLDSTESNESLNLPPIHKSNDAAYILYTSGSTGTPKGVVVEHRNMVAYVDAFQHEFQLTSKDIFLQQASCSFDQFVEEVFPVLLAGGQVVITRKTDVIDLPKLVQLIDHYEITIVSVSPLLLNELNKENGMASVRTFISGGDVLKPEYISALLDRADVYNTYGPTEATVCATYHRCIANSSRNSIPIGKPILNYRVYVLDPYGHPLPVGVSGEICIAGAGVARGYLNRPELTAQQFSKDPCYADERMYRTGDIGVWLQDGSLQYVGRNDQQVKIRGYRIELGDIEHRLLNHEAIDEAIVLAHEDEHGMMQLVAYVKTNRDVTGYELSHELAGSLPPYMIPAVFYGIDIVPKTSNGKLDRRALKLFTNRLASHVQSSIKDSDVSETENNIRRVWREVLKAEDVGLHDHFFDLGGNSILLMRLHAKLEKEFAWGLQIVDLFTYTTIARLAEWVDEKQRETESVGQPVWGSYQQLPPTFFHHQMNGSGMGIVSFHLQSHLYELVVAVAEENEVESFDVLSGMMLYLLSEWNEEPRVSIQCLVEGGEQVVPIMADLHAIKGFEQLFQYVHTAQKSEETSRYAIRRIHAYKHTKEENDVLPLIYRELDLELDAHWLEAYDIAWGIEDQVDEDQFAISIKYNDRRIKKEAIHTLVGGYVDLLGQMAKSRVMV
ncbi:amino acid adenylation domain-containing protein [Paenibacillus sp. L3-i20]|uniref:non-ribosomal peptide synthetase n=1 Tax=Paenibacillus sp. L3-i20 TaxID=2905833 RepID=UPI001EDEF3E9|nr:amino acid adenylation domain-containing protein [Paenibacillus sp. L3-i20]GKU76572.1 hypothetical protein L3i20_v209690 [Paenibacillus sp. L3-i20]